MTELASTDFLEQLVSDENEASLEQVAGLENQRAWISLRRHLLRRHTHLREKTIRGVFRKNGEPVDQREVDYARGVLDTIEWILSLPSKAKEEVKRSA